jgi:hypothetical protein
MQYIQDIFQSRLGTADYALVTSSAVIPTHTSIWQYLLQFDWKDFS